ncbi:MAG: LysE family translocator, partial [Planctomycetota bacterium]
MLTIQTVAAFSCAACLLALAPGPDNLFVLTQSIVYGQRAGLMVTLGLCTGLVGHSLAVACGVAAFVRTPLTFTTLKCLGVGYLLYLAWQAFHATTFDLKASGQGPSGLGTLYRRGIVMNATNPKVSLFFLAFL